jgi:threonyl-tRNA synthetase
MVFWHSSAHVLGEACELEFHCHLCHGPPTDDGFFYDMGMPSDVILPGASAAKTVIVPDDFGKIDSRVQKIMKEKQKFERLELSKDVLLEMFDYNEFKKHFIREKIPDGTSTTVYRCGPLIDLCLGPHIPHTGRIKAMKVTKNSASYFQGDSSQVKKTKADSSIYWR